MLLSHPKKTKILLGLVLVVILVAFLYSVFHTFQSTQKVQAFRFSSAANSAKKALFFPKTLNTITFHSLPLIALWEDGLQQVMITQNVIDQGSLFVTSALESNNTNTSLETSTVQKNFHDQLSIFNQNLQSLTTNLKKSWMAQKIVPKNTQTQIEELSTLNSDLSIFVDHFFTGQHTYIIVLQNSQEIRATGGFMGSYAKIELDEGTVKNLHIEDIYQPDGQFTGYIEAPTGVAEYLSGGNGWRLPDSNWSPDFPTSAQTILSFFAEGGEKNIDGLIAVNLSVVENILQVMGELSLPDYDVTVTGDNLADVARADRDEFFPGSQQKPNFLNALLKQMMLRSQDLTPEGKKEIIAWTLEEIPRKNIQFYSTKPNIQELFQKYHLDGAMNSHSENTKTTPPSYLFLVESNVGINKANKKVQRTVDIEIEEMTMTVTINFTNKNAQTSLSHILGNTASNQKDSLHYVNYQRLFLLPNTSVSSIEIDNEPLSKWDTSEAVTANGETFQQIGFLVAVPENSSSQVVMRMALSEPFSLHPQLILQKQAGLPPTPYTIHSKNEQKSLLLEKDKVISW